MRVDPQGLLVGMLVIISGLVMLILYMVHPTVNLEAEQRFIKMGRELEANLRQMQDEANRLADELEYTRDDDHCSRMWLVTEELGPLNKACCGCCVPSSSVPIWIALYFRKEQRCKLVEPSWLSRGFLEGVKDLEVAKANVVGNLSRMEYAEMAKGIFEACPVGILEADDVRQMSKDIWEFRMSMLQNTVVTLIDRQSSLAEERAAANLTRTLNEMCAVRSFFPRTLAEELGRFPEKKTIQISDTDTEEEGQRSSSTSSSGDPAEGSFLYDMEVHTLL